MKQIIQRIIIVNTLCLLSLTGLIAQVETFTFYPTICNGESINISCTPTDPMVVPNVFSWSPATGLNSTTSQVVIASPTTTTTYTCTTDIGSTSITITVKPDPSASIGISGLTQSNYCTTDGILNLTGTPTNSNGFFTFEPVSASPGGSSSSNNGFAPGLTDNCDGTATLDLSQVQLFGSPTSYELSYTYYEGGEPDASLEFETLNFSNDANTTRTYFAETTPGQEYIFSLYDSYGDGITNGGVQINECQGGNLVNIYDNTGSFPGGFAQHQFVASACDLTETPSTCPSNIGGGFIEIIITTDNFPDETGWHLINVFGIGCGNTFTQILNISAGTEGEIIGLESTYCSSDAPDDILTDPVGGTLTISPDAPGALTSNGEIDIFDPGAYPNGETVTLTYEFTNNNGCTSITTATTTIFPEPDIVFTGLETSYCSTDNSDDFTVSPSGGTLTINPDEPGAISFDGTNYTFNPSFFSNGETVTFTYTVNNGGECGSTESFITTVNSAPNVNFFGLDLNYCTSSDDVTLFGDPVNGTFITNVPTGFTDNGDGTGVLDFDQIPAGTYDMSYTFTDANGCTGTSGIIAFTVDNTPADVLFIEPGNLDICAGETVILYADWDETTCPAPDESLGANNYIWTGGTTTPTEFRSSMVSVSPTTTTTYTVTAGGQSASVTINVIPDPVLDIENLNANYCIEENAFIVNGNIGNGNFSISPDPGSGFTDNGDGTAQIQPFAMTPNTYNLTYEIDEPAIIYEYPFGQSNSVFIEEISVQENGMYDLFIYDAFGDGFSSGGGSIELYLCGNLVGSSVYNNDAPGFSFEVFLIDVPVGCNLLEIIVTTDDFPTDFAMILQDINASCSGTVTETFTINELPTVTISTDSEEYCSNDEPFLITVSPPGGTLTSFPDVSGGITPSGDNFLFDPAFVPDGLDAFFTYTFTNAAGCSSDNDTRVLIFVAPEVSFSGLPTSICADDASITLTGDPAGGVFTTDAPSGLNGNILTPSQVPTGQIFTIEYSFMSNQGCEGFQAQTFTVGEDPTVTISTDSEEYCSNNEPFLITVSPPGGTLTSFPDVSGGITPSGDNFLFDPAFVPDGLDAFFTYSFTNAAGCSSDNDTRVLIFVAPEVSFSGLPASICADDAPITLTGEPTGGVFTTTAPAGLNGNVLDPSQVPTGQSFTIEYSFMSSNGCEDFQQQTFIVDEPEEATIVGLEPEYCADNNLVDILVEPFGGTLTISPDASGALTFNGEFYSFDPSAFANGETVTFTYVPNNNGCVGETSEITTIHSLPDGAFTNLENSYFDNDPIVNITAISAGGTFTSSEPTGFTDNGNGTATLDPTIMPVGGPYDITYAVTDANGCFATTTQQVTILSGTQVLFTGLNPTYCEFEIDTVLLTGLPTDSEGVFTSNVPQGFFDNGDGTAVLVLTNLPLNTEFEITYTYPLSSTQDGSDTQTFEIFPFPTPFIELDDEFYCEDEPNFTITATPNSGFFYSNAPDAITDNGNGNATFSPSAAGQGIFTIYYSVTNEGECETIDSIPVYINALEFTDLDSFYCVNFGLVSLVAIPELDSVGTFFTNAPAGLIDNEDGTATLDSEAAGVGTFTVFYEFVSGLDGCSDTTSQEITFLPLPDASFNGSNVTYFENGPIDTLFAVDTFGYYLTNAPAGFTDLDQGIALIDPSTMPVGGPYDIIYETVDTFGCFNTDTQQITILPPTQITFTGLSPIYCENDTTTVLLTGNPTDENGTFTSNLPNGFTDNGDGTATLILTNLPTNTEFEITYTYDFGNGQTGEDTQTFEINPIPEITLSNIDNFYCQNAPDFTITATPNSGNFSTNAPDGLIDNGNGEATFSPSFSGTGIFTIYYHVFDDNDCENTDSVSFEIGANPMVTIDDFSAQICSNDDPITLMGTPAGGMFSTDAPSGLNGNILDPSEVPQDQGFFINYSFTDANGCEGFASEFFTVSPAPDATFTGLASDYCADEDLVTLTVSDPFGMMTADPDITGAITTDGTNFFFDPSVYPNSETVTITYVIMDEVCDDTFSQTTTVNPAATATISGLNAAYCANETTFTITGNPSSPAGIFTSNVPNGFTDNGDGTATLDPTMIPTGTTFEITYTYSDGNNCEGIATETFTINELPTVSFTGLAPSYTNTAPPVMLTGNPTNGIFTFSVPNGLTDNGNGTATLDPSDTPLGGPYEVIYTFTDANGCTNSQAQQVSITEQIVVDFSGLEAAYCADADLIELTGSPTNENGVFTTTAPDGLTDNGDGTASLNVSFVPTGQEFSVTYTYTDPDNGQMESATQNFIVNELPMVTIENLAAIYCSSDDVVTILGMPTDGLEAVFTSAVAGFMDNGDGTASFDPSAAGIGIYEVTYLFTNNDGCTNSITQTVEVQEIPMLVINDFPANICENDETFDFSAMPQTNGTGVFTTSAPNGLMDNGDGTATFDPTVNSAGTYEIIYTFNADSGCENQVSQIFEITPLPNADFTGLAMSYFNNDPIVNLTATLADGAFSSSEPTGFTDNGDGIATLDPTTMPVGGPYDITYSITDINGCMNSTTQQVTILSAAEVTFTGLSPTYCEGNNSTIILTGNPTDANGIFTSNLPNGLTDNGDGTASLDLTGLPIDTEFEIIYTYDFGNGQTGEDTQIFEITPLPNADFTGLVMSYFNNDPIVNLTATLADGTFTSSEPTGFTDNGDGIATLDPTTMPVGGPYDITYSITDINGCMNSTTQQVTILSAAEVTFTGLSPTYCESDNSTIILTGNPTDANGVFTSNLPNGLTDNGDGTASLDLTGLPIDTEFEITYSYDFGNGQTGEDTQIFEIGQPPIISFTPLDAIYCSNDGQLFLTGNPLPMGISTATFTSNIMGNPGIIDNGDGTAMINLGQVPTGEEIEITYELNTDGCVSTFSQTIFVTEVSEVSFTQLDAEYCPNGIIEITGSPLPIPANATAGYQVNFPTGFTDNGDGTATVDLSQVPQGQPLNIILAYLYDGGCLQTSLQTFTVPTTAPVSFTELEELICGATELINLQGNPAPTFGTEGIFSSNIPNNMGLTDNGDGNATLDPLTVPNDEIFEIYYTFIDENECMVTDTQTVTFGVDEALFFTGIEADEICNDEEQLVLIPSSSEPGEWSTTPPGLLVIENDTAFLPLAGIANETGIIINYSLTNGGVCTQDVADTIVVLAAPELNLPDTLVLCGAGTYLLENVNPDDEILWSTGATTPEIMIDIAGTYSVEIVSPNGCFVTDTMVVLVEMDLDFLSNFLVAQAACVGDTIHFIDISNVQIQADAYFWDFGDGTVSTERDPTHIYTDAGSYDVRFQATALGCDTFDIVKPIQLAACRLLPGGSAFSTLTVAPNPNNGDFYVEIELHDRQPVIVTIFDFQGRKIDTRKLDFKPYYKVEFDDLPNGVYTVQVQSLREQKVAKVIVF